MPKSLPETLFVIVRHGNTFAAGEAPRRIGARTDLPLTADGMAQAHALGAHFAALGLRFSRVLVSPLARTRATASAISEHLPDAPAPQSCDWLREIDHGPDEDRPEEAVLARIGAEALAAWDERAEPPPGWTVDAAGRRDAWRALFATDAGPTLLVTSNGAARFALLADPALTGSGTGAPGRMKLPTGAYGVIRRAAGGALALVEWGRRP
ncbi:histidine phosphatase family protein [Sphingomonas abietis]|uniref:Histidine phosphatase family protein n=1 Tax=Sphingomonas abietis TaxID=3012344 RepID=A0ABY7NNV5_9SPHN|nr:histidine phosphatase family protein [Sphingomonas abietis]WBO23043.1 histidine phosphatase family protein [Sphingomonas abietis]